jgi:hypothetical protein
MTTSSVIDDVRLAVKAVGLDPLSSTSKELSSRLLGLARQDPSPLLQPTALACVATLLDVQAEKRLVQQQQQQLHMRQKKPLPAQALAARILVTVLRRVKEWPFALLRVYMKDALGGRQWIDHEDCAELVANLRTAWMPLPGGGVADAGLGDTDDDNNNSDSAREEDEEQEEEEEEEEENGTSAQNDSDSSSGDEMEVVCGAVEVVPSNTSSRAAAGAPSQAATLASLLGAPFDLDISSTNISALEPSPPSVANRYQARRLDAVAVVVDALRVRLESSSTGTAWQAVLVLSEVATLPQARQLAAQHMGKWLQSLALSKHALSLLSSIARALSSHPAPSLADDVAVVDAVCSLQVKASQLDSHVEQVTALAAVRDEFVDRCVAAVLQIHSRSKYLLALLQAVGPRKVLEALGGVCAHMMALEGKQAGLASLTAGLAALGRELVRAGEEGVPPLVSGILRGLQGGASVDDSTRVELVRLAIRLSLEMVGAEMSSTAAVAAADGPGGQPKKRQLQAQRRIAQMLFYKSSVVPAVVEAAIWCTGEVRSRCGGADALALLNSLLFLSSPTLAGPSSAEGEEQQSSLDWLGALNTDMLAAMLSLSHGEDPCDALALLGSVEAVIHRAARLDDLALKAGGCHESANAAHAQRPALEISDADLLQQLYALTLWKENLALAGPFWRVCLCCLLFAASSPQSIARHLWDAIPTVRCLMQMVVCGQFEFPPPGAILERAVMLGAEEDMRLLGEERARTVLSAADERQQRRRRKRKPERAPPASRETVSQRGRRRLARFVMADILNPPSDGDDEEDMSVEASGVEQETQEEREVRVLGIRVKDLVCYSVSGPARAPPPDVLAQLRSLDEELSLGARLRRSTDPDLITAVVAGEDDSQVTRDSSERSAAWLASCMAAEPEVIIPRLPTTILVHLTMLANFPKASGGVVIASLAELAPYLCAHVRKLLFSADSADAFTLLLADLAARSEGRRWAARQTLQSLRLEDGSSQRSHEEQQQGEKGGEDSWLGTLLEMPCFQRAPDVLRRSLVAASETETSPSVIADYLITLGRMHGQGLTEALCRLLPQRRITSAAVLRCDKRVLLLGTACLLAEMDANDKLFALVRKGRIVLLSLWPLEHSSEADFRCLQKAVFEGSQVLEVEDWELLLRAPNDLVSEMASQNIPDAVLPGTLLLPGLRAACASGVLKRLDRICHDAAQFAALDPRGRDIFRRGSAYAQAIGLGRSVDLPFLRELGERLGLEAAPSGEERERSQRRILLRRSVPSSDGADRACIPPPIPASDTDQERQECDKEISVLLPAELIQLARSSDVKDHNRLVTNFRLLECWAVKNGGQEELLAARLAVGAALRERRAADLPFTPSLWRVLESLMAHPALEEIMPWISDGVLDEKIFRSLPVLVQAPLCSEAIRKLDHGGPNLPHMLQTLVGRQPFERGVGDWDLAPAHAGWNPGTLVLHPEHGGAFVEAILDLEESEPLAGLRLLKTLALTSQNNTTATIRALLARCLEGGPKEGASHCIKMSNGDDSPSNMPRARCAESLLLHLYIANSHAVCRALRVEAIPPESWPQWPLLRSAFLRKVQAMGKGREIVGHRAADYDDHDDGCVGKAFIQAICCLAAEDVPTRDHVQVARGLARAHPLPILLQLRRIAHLLQSDAKWRPCRRSCPNIPPAIFEPENGEGLLQQQPQPHKLHLRFWGCAFTESLWVGVLDVISAFGQSVVSTLCSGSSSLALGVKDILLASLRLLYVQLEVGNGRDDAVQRLSRSVSELLNWLGAEVHDWEVEGWSVRELLQNFTPAGSSVSFEVNHVNRLPL